MPNSRSPTYGISGYLDASAQIAERDNRSRIQILLRMLAARLKYQLSAVEYAQYGLDMKPFGKLGSYQTKKQTTILFDRINPHAERPAVEDKLRFHQICLEAGLPVPRLYAVMTKRGTKIAGDFPILEYVHTLFDRFRDRDEVRLILKPQNDALGTGVRFVAIRRGRVFDITGKPIELADFTADLYADMQRDDYLVQEFVRPHPLLARLGSGKALGTLRLFSWLHDSRVRILYALARIPCGDNPHDNFSAGSTGNLISAIDIATGRLGPAYGCRDSHSPRLLECFARNPDTGEPIAGVYVPQWAAIGQLVERAAHVFPGLPALGWDFALSDTGVVIIEANSNPDIIGIQVSCGYGARDVLQPLYASIH